MGAVFRSLRGFALFFLFVLLILLATRLVIGWSGQGTNGFTTEFTNLGLRIIDTAFLLLSLVGTVVLTVFLFVLVISIVRLVFVSIMLSPVVSETQPLNRLFGAAVAALFFSQLVVDIYRLARVQVMVLFSDVSNSLAGSFREGMACIESLIDPVSPRSDTVCITSFFFDASRTIRNVAIEFFGSSGLGSIDPVNTIGALAVFLLVTILSSRIRSDLDPRQQFWVAYGAVAFFATYLTLSAILAVPLLSEDVSETPRPAAQLRTSLEEMLPSQPSKPDLQTKLGESIRLASLYVAGAIRSPDSDEKDIQVSVEGALSGFRTTASSIDDRLDSLYSDLNRLQSDATQRLKNNLNAAVLSYELEIDIRRGQREASRHFADLRNWFQFTIDETLISVNDCRVNVENAEESYRTSVDFLRSGLEGGHGGTVEETKRFLDSTSRRLDDEGNIILSSVREAEFRCQTLNHARYVPPGRSDFGSFLGVVGSSASWLLSTESMEVALLTGLIGFGLLGALVAQFVKSGGVQEFEFAQIATVVFSGFCAAIVVYVTAYGGLAITSTSGSNPNPYVVFGACLVGAVFSAEIWERAKKWIVSGKPPG